MTKATRPSHLRASDSDQLEIGTRIVERVIQRFSPIFILIPVALLYRATFFGGMVLAITQSLLVSALWFTSFTSRFLPATYRMSVYISALAAIGILGLLHWGFLGTAQIPIVLSIILASMLGFQRWLMFTGTVMLFIVGVALTWIFGERPIAFDSTTMMHSPYTWCLLVLSLIGLAGASFVWEGIHQRMLSAMRKLRENEQKYRDIIDATNDALFIHDPDGAILDVNMAACNLFGINRKDISHYSIKGLSASEPSVTRDDVLDKIREAFEKGSLVFEWKARKTDGTAFWSEVALRASVIEGKPRVIASIRDISPRKTAEKEKDKLENELRQSQKLEAVGRLAGGVAHDFNNMLGVIIGHTEMAIEEAPAHLIDSLMEIQTAAERSANLTRQLLVFARRQTVAPKILDLNQTVSGMLKILMRLIGEHIDLAWSAGENLWPIKIDPTQVDQILTNLCVNARDAMGTVGKMTIETSNVTLDDWYCHHHTGFIPGEFVLLAVSDDGCGMDQHTQDNLFEPFFTTKGTAHGSGLGLATLYGIVKQNKGFINVYSELELGTTFKIYLPRSTAEALDTHEEKPAKPLATGSETILLVEDEQSIMKMAAMMLEQKGYTVLTAPKPNQAIRLARAYSEDIHLLITDVVMPEMNGRDLAKNLIPIYPDLKILYMSGYTANVIAHHGVLDEGIHFIQKPFSKHDLLSKVRGVLDFIEEKCETTPS